MLDVARLVFMLLALHASVRARLGGGIVAASALLVVLAIELGLVLRFPLEKQRLEMVFGALILGPTSIPHEPPIALTAIFVDPLHHVAAALVSGLAARSAFVRSRGMHPELEQARRIDRAGLCFVALGVLHGLLVVPGLLGRVVFGGE